MRRGFAACLMCLLAALQLQMIGTALGQKHKYQWHPRLDLKYYPTKATFPGRRPPAKILCEPEDTVQLNSTFGDARRLPHEKLAITTNMEYRAFDTNLTRLVKSNGWHIGRGGVPWYYGQMIYVEKLQDFRIEVLMRIENPYLGDKRREVGRAGIMFRTRYPQSRLHNADQMYTITLGASGHIILGRVYARTFGELQRWKFDVVVGQMYRLELTVVSCRARLRFQPTDDLGEPLPENDLWVIDFDVMPPGEIEDDPLFWPRPYGGQFTGHVGIQTIDATATFWDFKAWDLYITPDDADCITGKFRDKALCAVQWLYKRKVDEAGDDRAQRRRLREMAMIDLKDVREMYGDNIVMYGEQIKDENKGSS